MSTISIFSSAGVRRTDVDDLVFRDEWMAECYLMVSVKSANPVNFAIGDYIMYRGAKYVINYDPTVLKKARCGTYGEGFTYDNIKFVFEAQSKIVDCDFTDLVLNDNQMHYTSLPAFPFYCESVDDLLDRVQACLEELYPGEFILIGLNTVRNAQRGLAVGRQQAFTNAYKQYVDPSGTARTDPYGKQSVALTVDNITCWEAVTKIHSDFGLNFIQRGNVIVAGINGVFTSSTFRYGKGNGLYEIERIADSSQQIVTRLKAYGSETNLPIRYYAELNMQVFGNVERLDANYASSGLHYAAFTLDIDFAAGLFKNRSKSYPGPSATPNFIVRLTANDITVTGYVTKDANSNRCYFYCEYGNGVDDDRDETDEAAMNAFSEAIALGDRVDLVAGIEKSAFPDAHKDYATENLPNNMAISRLMLPGFPNQSLYDWVRDNGGTNLDNATGRATIAGFTGYFSKDRLRPWIQSLKSSDYGVRPGNIYFDGTDETDDIHPTIEGIKIDNVPVDQIHACEQITDNGVFSGEAKVPNFTITLPNLGFDLAELYQDETTIEMKDGMCGARSFKLASKPVQNMSGYWECEVERAHDEALDLWFPYNDFQVSAGDHFVITGIELPSFYVSKASERMFYSTIDALQKNDSTRFTYQPRIDEIWMARQHDNAEAGTSLHDTLHAGDVFLFGDEDLNIDEGIIIDVLSIHENDNNGLPTYEVTLRDEKQVSTIQRMIDKATSSTGAASGGGGFTSRQIQSLIENYGGEQFLSKINDDTAQGFIRFLQGLQVGNQFVSGLLGEGGVFRREADGTTYFEADKMYVRMKAYFDTVEVREYKHSAGNRVASPAGAKCVRVAWFNSSNVELEQTQANLSSVAYFRCFFRASDGEDTVRNNFVVGDQIYCHITSVAGADDNPEIKGLNQKHYWRLCIGRNTEGTLTEDGEAWIDISNRSTETISGRSYTGYQSGSDTPAAQDSMEQLGNVNDSTRQGAIIEFVTGANAPAYHIYQGINSFSLNGKNKITLGYNSSTGRAELKVYGDAYIGDPNGSTFIKYEQENPTTHKPKLSIKAEIEAQSTIGNQSLPDYIKNNQNNYDDTEVQQAISNLSDVTDNLQAQIDGQIESWFYNGTPGDSVLPESEWKAIDIAAGNNNERLRHLGDMYYDNETGYAYRYSNSGTESNPVFYWNTISDSAVVKALADAAAALGLADTKAKIFSTASDVLPTPPYKVNDIWVNATGTWGSGASAVTWENEILKCTNAKTANQQASINDWAKASKYTDDSAFNGYINAFLNGSGATGDSAAAAAIQKAIASALGSGAVVAGGLLLTSLIGMRQNVGTTENPVYETWGGISGQYDNWSGATHAKGHGIAAWYGGAMVDKEDVETLPSSYAKSLFRFDGSGYLAGGNITWDDQGRVAIKDITTLIGGNNTNILNELTTFNNAFHFTTSQGSSTILSISPQAGFTSLSILDPEDNTLKPVATQEWVNGNYITKTFFNRILKVHYKKNGVDSVLDPNDDFPAGATDKCLESVFSFWTNYALTALGQGQDGSVSYTTLAQLNDVTLTNPTANQVLSYNGTHWVNRSIELGSQTLADLADVTITSPAANQMLGYDATTQKWKNIAIPATGVTSVALSMPTGFSITGSPITASGTFTVTFASGYSLPTTAKQSNWDTAYGWGDHASAGYALAANLGTASSHAHSDYLTSLSWDSTNKKLAWAKGGTAQTAITIGYASVAGSANSVAWSAVTGTPTTIAGYGITDAKIANGVITLGANTITPLTSHQTLYTLSVYGGTTKVLDFKPNNNASLYIKAGGDISLTNDTTNKYITLSYSHPTNGANTTISAANGRVLSAIAVNSLGHVTSVSYKTLAAADIPDLSSTYSTSTRVSTLEGYFTSGVANSAAKLTTVSKTAWGQTFWTSGGVPTSISGSLSSVTNITMSGFIKIGDAYLSYDSTNNAIRVSANADGTGAMNFYARGGVSALGETADGQAGVGDVTWVLLADGTDTRQIALSHLTTSLTTITGGTTDATNKRYAVYKNSSNQLFVDVPWTAGSGTVTSVKVGTTSYTPTNGVISLPAYPTVPTKVSQLTNDSGYITSYTNTWRNIYVSGTEKLTTAITTKGLNFAAGSNVSLSFAAAGTGSGQSGNANYGTITISATDTTYESKAAASGGTAVSLVTTGEKYTWNSKAAGNHTHTTSIATSTAANQLTLAFGTKYAITAGGTSYVFTMPSNPNTNTTYKFTIGSTTKGDATNGVDLGTLKSETAASGGTTLSLVTTGEKYSWNNKTYTTSIATDSGTNQLTLAFGTKYKLTAGGTSFVFTMPSNPDTDVNVKVNNTNPTTGTWYYPVWYTATNGTGNVNANDGFRYYSLQGTASALGESYLQIGNSTASGTAGNKRGHLRIYGNKAYYGEFNMIDNLSENKTYTFDTAGTILTSGNSSVTKSGQTLTVTINGTSLSLTNSTYTLAGLMGSTAIGSTTEPIYWTGTAFAKTTYKLEKSVPSTAVFTDHYDWSDITSKPLTLTKNTTGFSISGGATTSKTLTVSESYTLGAACAKGVTDNSSNADVTSSDTNLITGRTLYYQLAKKGYTTNTGTVTSVATGTGLTGGTITTSGTISINSTYQTYISNGNTAYGWGNHANANYMVKGSFDAVDNERDGWGELCGSSYTPLLRLKTAKVSDDYGCAYFAYKNYGTKDTRVSMQVDGYFYQNEGQYRVLDTSDASGLSVNYANSAYSSSYSTYATYATYLNASYSNGDTTWTWNPLNQTQYYTWGQQFKNANVSTDTGDMRLYIAANNTSAGGLGLWLNIDGGINAMTSLYAGEYVQVGNIKMIYDSTNNAIKVIKNDGTAANFYATGGISAFGAGQESGGGGSYLPLSGGSLSGTLSIRPYSLTNNNYNEGIRLHPYNNWCSLVLCGSENTGDSGTSENTWGVFNNNGNFHINKNGSNHESSTLLSNVSDRWIFGGDSIWNANAEVTIYNATYPCLLLKNTANDESSIYFENAYSSNKWAIGLGVWGGTSSNGFGIGDYGASLGLCFYINTNGTCIATHGFSNQSDVRFKTKISDIELSVEQIAKMPTILYRWNDREDARIYAGSIAQNWESVLPQVVDVGTDPRQFRSLQYGVAALISAITVARKVMTHEEKIALLETRVSALEKENGEQEQLINSLQEELSHYKIA